MQIGCGQGRRRSSYPSPYLRPQIPDPSAMYRTSKPKQPLSLASCKTKLKVADSTELVVSRGGPNWSLLPIDILLVILGRLPIKDYLRFGAVCGPRRRNKACSTCPVPPLVNPFTAEEHCRIKLLPHNELLASTADGYIVHLNKNSELLIMNPMTRKRIQRLPSTTTLPSLPHGLRWEPSRAALLRRQSTIFVAISCKTGSTHSHLAFSSPGDETWTFLADTTCTIVDALTFYKGLLYVLCRNKGTMIWDFRGDHPPRPMPTLAPKNGILVRFSFLVESSTGDDLYQVLAYQSGKHEIFKLQAQSSAGTPNWCTVTALPGDDVLMLSPLRALCVSAGDFPMLRPNFIYSTLYYCNTSLEVTDRWPHWPLGYYGPLCVFNLDNGTMESLPIGRYITNLTMTWFSPHLH